MTSTQTLADIKNIITTTPAISIGKFGDLDTLDISSEHCTARISLFGAHVLSFRPNSDQSERLWISEKSIKDGSKPVRGGIPICWPWFGANIPELLVNKAQRDNITLPSHGFVRTQTWILINAVETNNGISLTLQPSQLGLLGVSMDLSAQLVITFSHQCEIKLITTNNARASIKFGAALHSYFAVDDIAKVEVDGLCTGYIDKTRQSTVFPLPTPYTITEEVDRVHGNVDSQSEQSLQIIQNKRKLTSVVNAGNNACVIWNPWLDKARELQDMRNEDYTDMLCIESAIVEPIELMAQQSHTLIQVIS